MFRSSRRVDNQPQTIAVYRSGNYKLKLVYVIAWFGNHGTVPLAYSLVWSHDNPGWHPVWEECFTVQEILPAYTRTDTDPDNPSEELKRAIESRIIERAIMIID